MPPLTVTQELINSFNGQLPHVSYVGLYNLMYFDNAGTVFCSDCATKRFKENETLFYQTYDEGPTLYCEDCNAAIESNYGDPTSE